MAIPYINGSLQIPYCENRIGDLKRASILVGYATINAGREFPINKLFYSLKFNKVYIANAKYVSNNVDSFKINISGFYRITYRIRFPDQDNDRHSVGVGITINDNPKDGILINEWCTLLNRHTFSGSTIIELKKDDIVNAMVIDTIGSQDTFQLITQDAYYFIEWLGIPIGY